MGITTDPDDPRLGHGTTGPVEQHEVHLVLSQEERDKGFIRPFRTKYVHVVPGCGAVTSMNAAIAATYARDPHFYGSTYCVGCKQYKRVGAQGEFLWDGTGIRVGT